MYIINEDVLLFESLSLDEKQNAIELCFADLRSRGWSFKKADQEVNGGDPLWILQSDTYSYDLKKSKYLKSNISKYMATISFYNFEGVEDFYIFVNKRYEYIKCRNSEGNYIFNGKIYQIFSYNLICEDFSYEKAILEKFLKQKGFVDDIIYSMYIDDVLLEVENFKIFSNDF